MQRLLNEGRITPQEAVHHPHRNVIMRVLGDVDASPELELQTLDAVPGERWVLASDGLDSVVPDSDIEAVLRSTDDLEQIADVLIQMTLERGAPDNVTVVVAQVIDRSVLLRMSRWASLPCRMRPACRLLLPRPCPIPPGMRIRCVSLLKTPPR